MDEVRHLAADLSKASGKAQRAAGRALRKTAYDIAARAQELVPVDTGATKNSISVDMGVGGTLTAIIGPTTAYAPHLEHGTSRMAPRPFMAPAADAALPGLEQALTQIGGDIL